MKTTISAVAAIPVDGSAVTMRVRVVTAVGFDISRNETKCDAFSRAVLLATVAFTFRRSCGRCASVRSKSPDQFSVIGIKVDATALSPRAARDLAMTQGRPLAWSKLFRRFTGQPIWGTEPQLAERELLGLILSSDAGNYTAQHDALPRRRHISFQS